MENLTTKQKIIVGAIISVVIVIIGIYGYSMLQQEENWEQDTLLSDEDLQNKITNQEGENTITEGPIDTVIEPNINNETEENNGKSLSGSSSNIYENMEEKIVIHMTGAVLKTGILVLPEGARIADAIDASRRSYRTSGSR